MRVIAGSAGGIPLTPPPEPTRPTMDKVRAAVFSALGDLVPEARVLDLFAGSGGYGIEALSRGAASATLVENNERCLRVIRQNLLKTKLQASVQSMDVFRFCNLYALPDTFDLVFADPPYTKQRETRDAAQEILQGEQLPLALSEHGMLVLEFYRQKRPEPGTLWELLREKSYGETGVFFLRPKR